MATIGAVVMSSTLSADGNTTFLSTGNSPDAEKLASKNSTMQSKKSINGMSGTSWFNDLCPPPATFFATNCSGTPLSSRRPGTEMG
jgi:hypothetical protein